MLNERVARTGGGTGGVNSPGGASLRCGHRELFESGDSEMSIKEKLITAVLRNPSAPAREIAADLGLAEAWVAQVMRSNGFQALIAMRTENAPAQA